MYGMSAKRFDPDIYKKDPVLKKLDFILGFLVMGLVWFLFFKPIWWAAPLAGFCVSMIGILIKFKHRYVIYGALSLIFFPLVLWGGLMVVWAGRNEIKS
jgi:hypothetical protein